MRARRHRVAVALVLLASVACAAVAAAAASVSVRVQRSPTIGRAVRVTFRARSLPNHGYYYAVLVLKPYRAYTRASPPPCATSSNMLRTDYGHSRHGVVALALTPARSATGHWCRGGSYSGGIYAVPHAPPCNSSYPCEAETHKEPCAGVAPGCVLGVIVRPHAWGYPDGLPSHAYRTSIVGRFTVTFPR